MLFLHYQFRLIFAICMIVISHGAFINEEISSIPYIDRSNMSLFIHQHIQIENKTHHIHISPLALFDINQIKLIENSTTMIIPLILYTDEQIKFILENNTDRCKQDTIKCLFHLVSTETMRVIYKQKFDQTVYHQYIYSIRLANTPLSNQRLLYVNIDCTSHEACLKLSKKPIDLYLEYSIQQPEQHQVIIADKHFFKINIHSSKLLLERDVDRFLQELLDVANIVNNSEYILSQIDIFLLKETLKKQLLGKIWILTDDNDEKLWNSIYWKNNYLIRPDRLLKILKKKINSKYSSNKIVKNGTDMDEYIREIFDEQNFDLYLKYRHLFELHKINDAQGELSLSLKLKPILAYELNKFNRSSFLIHQTIHKTKRDYIHSIPIRSIAPLKQTQSVSQRFMKTSQLPTTSTTTESTQIEHIETDSDESADSTEVPFMSTSDSDAASITPSISTTTEMIQTTTQSSTTISPANTSVTIRYGSAHGGSGGGSFDDGIDLKLSPMKPCIGVEVFWRSHLFAIRFIYEQDDDSTQKFYHGNHTYERETNHSLLNETFLLSKEERIYKVTWYVGTGTQLWSYGGKIIHYVLGIQFYTTTGRMSPFYGEKGGEEFTQSYGGFTLGYAQGKSGSLVDSLRFVWYNQGPFGKTYNGVWVEAEEGKVPPDAVVGGLEDNRRVYVVRFKTREGNMVPGRLVEGNKIAECDYFGPRTSSSYQVLINPDSNLKFKWVATNFDNRVPEGAFLAGKEEQNYLYVGRVRVSPSLIHLGKYNVPHLYFTYEGKGKRLDDNIEVLCVS